MVRTILLFCILALVFDALEGAPFGVNSSQRPSPLTSLKGGSTAPDTPAPKKKRKKKKSQKSKQEALEEEKKVIVDALREKDAETALGDAIRCVAKCLHDCATLSLFHILVSTIHYSSP